MANYYHLLQSKEYDEEEEGATGNGIPSPAGIEYDPSNLWSYYFIFLAVWIIAVTFFIAGCWFNFQLLLNGAGLTEDLSFLSPPGPITTTFIKDPRFRQPPSAESDEAWLSILPNGLGIISHPSLLGTDEPVSLAFVHQLHCLIKIRKSYFAAKTSTYNDTNNDNDDESDHDETHILHCLDYIRQSLQCHADMNLEYRVTPSSSSPPSGSSPSSISAEEGEEGEAKKGLATGFSGYGEHQCRDFEGAFRFAERWRVG